MKSPDHAHSQDEEFKIGPKPEARSPRPAPAGCYNRALGSHYFSEHSVGLRAELGRVISRDLMRELHRKSAARHLVVALRQFLILALATWGLVHFTNPLVWVPLAFVQGFTVFNFTILLHEVVHH